MKYALDKKILSLGVIWGSFLGPAATGGPIKHASGGPSMAITGGPQEGVTLGSDIHLKK